MGKLSKDDELELIDAKLLDENNFDDYNHLKIERERVLHQHIDKSK